MIEDALIEILQYCRKYDGVLPQEVVENNSYWGFRAIAEGIYLSHQVRSSGALQYPGAHPDVSINYLPKMI